MRRTSPTSSPPIRRCRCPATATSPISSKPKGDITLKDGTWLALSAEAGVYRKKDELLDLEGNVNLFHDGGYEIATSRARIDLAKNSAEGDEPVVGQGPDTELQRRGLPRPQPRRAHHRHGPVAAA